MPTVADIKTSICTLEQLQNDYDGMYDLGPSLAWMRELLQETCIHEHVDVWPHCLICGANLTTENES